MAWAWVNGVLRRKPASRPASRDVGRWVRKCQGTTGPIRTLEMGRCECPPLKLVTLIL